MKVVLFCGGMGLRLRGHAEDLPKPMATIGARPILWHLMKYYAHYGHKDFIICLGYKGNCIKEYFLHYDESISNDLVLSQGGRRVEYMNRDIEDWTITFVETGIEASIGERLRLVEPYLYGEEQFLANYSDGLTDLHLPDMVQEFDRRNAIASLLLVKSTTSFDLVSLGGDGYVNEIRCLAETDIWINGGFFVFRKEIFQYIRPGEELVREPFARLIEQRALTAYKYHGFWRCMDTFKDKRHLEDMESKGVAPWKVWKDRTLMLKTAGSKGR